MKSVCKTCSYRHWCELSYCPHKEFAYEIDAERTYKNPSTPHTNAELYDKFKKLDQSARPQFHNRQCSLFLGDTVAETVLSKVFKNVVRTPIGHRGFDFWCNNKKKIDVKSSCMRKTKFARWGFSIDQNTIADYFLCIAFDNREDLTPIHLWLIPGEKVNHFSGISISQSRLDKWQEYELPIDKTVACCDTLRP